MKTLGVPTQLIIYPGEGHLFLDPKNQADRLEQTVGWFDKYSKQLGFAGKTARI